MTPRWVWPAIAAALIFAAGWFSHARVLTTRQANWKDSVEVARVRTEQALKDAERLRALADRASKQALEAATHALESRAAGQRAQMRTRAAQQALLLANSRADSGEAALVLVPLLEAQVDSAEAEASEWEEAYNAQQEASGALRARGDSLERVVARQDLLLGQGLKAMGRSGCRVPILGVKCPSLVVGYGVVADPAGGQIAVHHGIAAAIGFPLF